MLDQTTPDREIVRRWLSLALDTDDAAAHGKRTALAAYCGVTPQAVSGWLRTGRIGKRNLERAAHFLGGGPSFTNPAPIASEPKPPSYSQREQPAPPATPARDFHETRAPSNSEWQFLHDLAVYPTEERQKLLHAIHAEAERWRAIERELVARIKAASAAK